jgi:protein O-GlcNAc transferase
MVKTTFYYDNTEIIFEGLFESDHIYKQLSIKNNFYELKLLNKIKSLNLTGTYVDVGANIGNHTVFFSKFCPSDKVISIELSQNIFKTLKRNVTDNNNLLNVSLINVGVGEKYKTVTISDMDVTNVGLTKITSDGGDVIVDTLDNILQNETNISVIKIDVEGYEKNVLIGAKEIIKKHSPIIIAELKDDKEFNEFKEIADEIGYETDKVNYASTPTYIWVKKKKIINSFI